MQVTELLKETSKDLASSTAQDPARNVPFSSADPDLVWMRYCSFLDLPIQDFTEIQDELLMEQVQLVAESALGRRLLRGTTPSSVAEFRSKIPLTTYSDYIPFLAPGNDKFLAEKPAEWAHTTGAQAGFKSVPYTQRGLNRLLDNLMAAFILSSASNKGEVNVWPGDTILYNTPERPYVSGLVTFGMRERFGFKGVLSPETSELLEFKDRVRLSFQEALNKKIDVIVSMTSVLMKVGQGFAEHSKSTRFNRRLLKPRPLARMVRAYLKSKLFRRQMLPKDLWPAKAIVGWGIDTPFFREKVMHYWGKPPFELYACTEGGIMGMQTWKKEGLVFNPYSDFYEFIPLEESLKNRADDRYQPKVLRLNEVKPGETYEVVITNFYGMAFIRYRVGHFVKFLENHSHHNDTGLPQFTFIARADDRIDLAGFTRIDEKTVWEALNLTDLKYEDWTLRKEFAEDTPFLHMYIELKDERPEETVQQELDDKLKKVDPFYHDAQTMLEIHPLQITILSSGTYDRFYKARQEAGFELGQRKPPQMNATDQDIEELLRLSAPVAR